MKEAEAAPAKMVEYRAVLHRLPRGQRAVAAASHRARHRREDDRGVGHQELQGQSRAQGRSIQGGELAADARRSPGPARAARCIVVALPRARPAAGRSAAAEGRLAADRRCVDQSGAVIPGARVTLSRSSRPGCRVERPPTSVAKPCSRDLPPGRYAVRGEFPGSRRGRSRTCGCAPGATRRELRLPIARHAEDVQVGQDGRERALDPRSGAFASVLSRDQIDALPDDPGRNGSRAEGHGRTRAP